MKMTTAVLVVICGAASLSAQQAAPKQAPAPAPTGYKDTPKQAKGNWLIHDDDRPRPVVVKPGPFVGLPAPADAIVLLGSGTDLSKWQMQEGGGAVTWPIASCSTCIASRVSITEWARTSVTWLVRTGTGFAPTNTLVVSR